MEETQLAGHARSAHTPSHHLSLAQLSQTRTGQLLQTVVVSSMSVLDLHIHKGRDLDVSEKHWHSRLVESYANKLISLY